jgi:integrase/recombinase XerD
VRGWACNLVVFGRGEGCSWERSYHEKNTVDQSSSSFGSLTRFREHVQLKGLAVRSVEAYLCLARQLAGWAGRDPAELSEEEVRGFFVFLKNDRGYAPQSMRQARASLTAFYLEMLGRDWQVFATVKTRDVFKLPVVLSRDEVRRVLAAVRLPRFSICLRLIYECGLRLGEALRVQTGDIDRAGRRLHVRLGKGGKDRFVPLSAAMLEDLTQWWKVHRNPLWLFPAIGTAWKATLRTDSASQALSQAEVMRQATAPMSESALQNVFHRAVVECRLNKKASIHTLRHSYATHLLEGGVSIRLISQYLGHATLEQTLVYTHLTAVSEAQTQVALAAMATSLRQEM